MIDLLWFGLDVARLLLFDVYEQEDEVVVLAHGCADGFVSLDYAVKLTAHHMHLVVCPACVLAVHLWICFGLESYFDQITFTWLVNLPLLAVNLTPFWLKIYER